MPLEQYYLTRLLLSFNKLCWSDPNFDLVLGIVFNYPHLVLIPIVNFFDILVQVIADSTGPEIEFLSERANSLRAMVVRSAYVAWVKQHGQ